MSTSIAQSILGIGLCCLGALPSMLWSMEFDLAARLAGMGVFAAAYAVVPHTPAFKAIWSRRRLRRAIQIGYGVRAAISLAFPFGMAADLIPGLWSMSITGLQPSSPGAFGLVFATTLLQGAFLHVILGCFIVMVYGIMALFDLQREDVTGHAFEVILPAKPVALAEPVQTRQSPGQSQFRCGRGEPCVRP